MEHNRLSFQFVWYDFWVGLYYDTLSEKLYICLIPMFVIKVNLFGTKLANIFRKADRLIGPCPDCEKPEFWGEHKECIPF